MAARIRAGYASWEQWDSLSPVRRERWTNDTINHMARELQAVDARKRGLGRPDAHVWTQTAMQQREAVEARMALATPVTVVISAMGNLAHPKHLPELQRMATQHSSRAVRSWSQIHPVLVSHDLRHPWTDALLRGKRPAQVPQAPRACPRGRGDRSPCCGSRTRRRCQAGGTASDGGVAYTDGPVGTRVVRRVLHPVHSALTALL